MDLSARIASIALLGITALAALLRFHSLPLRGLIYWDEAKFMLEGARLQTGMRILTGYRASLPQGKAIGTAKPTHALFIALAYALLGVHDYSGLVLSATASVLGVVLVYCVGFLLFDSTVGLVAGLVLAVSEYDVIYARSALSESDASALLLLGVVLWLLAIRRFRAPRQHRLAVFAAGLVFGIAFTTNYRMVVYIAALVGLDLIYRFFSHGSVLDVAGRCVLWLVGLAAAPCVWEAVDLVARSRGTVLFRSEISDRPTTYFQEALYQIHGGKQAAVHFAPLSYLQWFIQYEGWAAAVLLAAGCVIAVRKRSFPWLAALCPVGIPCLLYMWAPVTVPRNLAEAVPFAAVLIAATVVAGVRHVFSVSKSLSVLLAVSALIAGDGILHSWRLGSERSGFASAAQFLAARGARNVLTTNEVPVFYARGSGNACYALKMPHTLGDLAIDVASGYRYAILTETPWPSEKFIRRRMVALASFPETQSAAIGANLIAAENGRFTSSPYPVPRLVVYGLTLDGLIPPPGRVAPACNLNVL